MLSYSSSRVLNISVVCLIVITVAISKYFLSNYKYEQLGRFTF